MILSPWQRQVRKGHRATERQGERLTHRSGTRPRPPWHHAGAGLSERTWLQSRVHSLEGGPSCSEQTALCVAALTEARKGTGRQTETEKLVPGDNGRKQSVAEEQARRRKARG